MMTTSTTTLAVPDIGKLAQIQQAAAGIAYAVSSQLPPAAQERMVSLEQLISQGNNTLQQSVLRGVVALQDEVSNYKENPDVYSIEDLRALVTRLKGKIEPALTRAAEVRRFEEPDISKVVQNTRELLAQQADAAEQFEQALVEREAKHAEVQRDLKIIKTPSVLDVIKKQLPTDEQLGVIVKTFKDPTVSPELLKAAVGNLNKNFDLLAEGRQTVKLFASAREMGEALKRDRVTLNALSAAAEETRAVMTQLSQSEQVLAMRHEWLDQLALFANSWQTLDEAADKAADDAALIEALTNLQTYLLAVRHAYENA